MVLRLWLDGSAFNRAGHVPLRMRANPDAIKNTDDRPLDTVFAKHDNFTTYKQIDENHRERPV
ncbi:hypothetical protein ACOBV8_21915 (plasmid) [Pseudoalteromonas espejiana]